MSDAFDALIGSILAEEGGYSDNASDPGRVTNFGITEAVARANGYTGDMLAMTRDQAVALYRAIYWQKPGFAAVYPISPAIAAKLLDAGVNIGVATVSTFLQRALDVLHPDHAIAKDGAVGPATLAVLSAYLAARPHDGETILLKALNCLQGARYVALCEANPTLTIFVNGWLKNRISST